MAVKGLLRKAVVLRPTHISAVRQLETAILAMVGGAAAGRTNW
jgi:hypothetical protein